MEDNAEAVSRRWETPLSDRTDLYFVGVHHEAGDLRFVVRDDAGKEYEVVVERPGPYRIADEQHLQDWGADTPRRGWTFEVSHPTWISDLQLRDLYIPDARCYVVATWDLCLEVLSEREPRVVPL